MRKINPLKKVLLTAVFLMITAVTFAAGFDGTWTTKVKLQDGNEFELTYVFKTESDKLTGIMLTPNGDLPLTNTKADDKNISFEMSFGEMTMKYTGTLKDDNTIILKIIDSPMGNQELTLIRKI